MLHSISFLTAGLIVVTGIFVLAKGEWRPHMLKFAGVCISTAAAMYMLAVTLAFHGVNYCTNEAQPMMCHTIELYYIARNMALIIFHVAIGRDAIKFKRYERRGTACQTRSPKQLPL